ncbi:MAG: hypothetical protein EB145_07130, partial [Proteobacteria bacterium]|nr:hypothetical protein [Pseudomonadota bacterium]
AESGNTSFGTVLDGISGKLQTAVVNGTLQTLVTDIIKETRAMAALNAALETRLQSSSSEMRGHQVHNDLQTIDDCALTMDGLSEPVTKTRVKFGDPMGAMIG